jgi:hypothetical protein
VTWLCGLRQFSEASLRASPALTTAIAWLNRTASSAAVPAVDLATTVTLFSGIEAYVYPPPAHHPMLRRIGAGFDKRGQFGLLLRGELRRRTRRLARSKPSQAFHIVPMHTVPEGLAIHPAALRRPPAVRAFQNKRKCQHPPRAVLSFSLYAALRSSDAVKSSRVIATAAPIDVAPLLKSNYRFRNSLIWES